MTRLFANWEINGNTGIWANGQKQSSLLLLGIVLFVAAILLVMLFGYYLVKFNREKAQAKLLNKPFAITTLAVLGVAAILGLMLLLFYSIPQTIFGTNGDALFAAYLIVAIFGFLILLIVIVLMWIRLTNYGIAFTDNKISFVGEQIAYSRITKIVKDTATGDIFINYTSGKRNLKKQKFSSSSVLGQFVLANVSLTGKELIEINQKDYVTSFETTENITEQRLPVIEKETTFESVQVDSKTSIDNKNQKVVKKTTTKPVEKKTQRGSNVEPIGKLVKNPKPVIYEEPAEITINSHDIPKYKD